MKKLRVGILSTGNIAGVMAETLNGMKEAELYGVASRSIEKAQAFAGKFGASKAYGSYEELAADEQVDLVYVATPMSEHYETDGCCAEAVGDAVSGGRIEDVEKSRRAFYA